MKKLLQKSIAGLLITTTLALNGFFAPKPAEAALIDSLLAYWSLEEASGTRDDAHSVYDLTDNNTVTNAAGIILNGADFENGTSEYLSKDSTTIGAPTTDTPMSFSFWVKPESNPGVGEFRQVLSYTVESGTGWQFFIDYVNSAGTYIIRCNRSGGTAASYNRPGAISTAAFTHYVCRYNGSTVELFENGVSVATGSASGVGDQGTNPNYIRIGQYLDGNGGVLSRYWDGIIDEFGIWNKNLSDAEVAALYNSGAGLAYPLTVAGSSAGILMQLADYF